MDIERVFNAQFVTDAALAGASLGVLALGLAVIYGVTGDFHFAYGSIFSVASYVVLNTYQSIPVALSILAAIGAAVAIGTLIEIAIYEPIRSRGGGSAAIFLGSLGIVTMLTVLLRIWGDFIYIIFDHGLARPVDLGSVTMIPAAILMLCLLIISVLGWHVVSRTQAGIRVRAVASDPHIAECFGIDRRLTYVAAYAVGSALSGLAAALTAFTTPIGANQGANLTLLAFVVVLLAPKLDLNRVAAFAMGMGLISALAGIYGYSIWRDSIMFGVLVIVLIAQSFRNRSILA